MWVLSESLYWYVKFNSMVYHCLQKTIMFFDIAIRVTYFTISITVG